MLCRAAVEASTVHCCSTSHALYCLHGLPPLLRWLSKQRNRAGKLLERCWAVAALACRLRYASKGQT